jgi:hypothetical protein
MEHPLIDNIDSLSTDELQHIISDLHQKYSYAIRTNAHLAHQIRMALETYQNKYNEKQQAIWQAQVQKGQDFSDKIDIS